MRWARATRVMCLPDRSPPHSRPYAGCIGNNISLFFARLPEQSTHFVARHLKSVSIVAPSTGEPTCTPEDLKVIAGANNFDIASSDEGSFLLFQNSFDATCQAIKDLPECEDPRTKPCKVEGGER